MRGRISRRGPELTDVSHSKGWSNDELETEVNVERTCEHRDYWKRLRGKLGECRIQPPAPNSYGSAMLSWLRFRGHLGVLAEQKYSMIHSRPQPRVANQQSPD